MANRTFDFNKIQRSIFTVETPDGKTLLIRMPKKGVFEKLAELQTSNEKASVSDITNTFSFVIAEIMSNNKAGVKITPEYVSDNYDIEEMTEFIKEYGAFVGGLKNDPN